MEQQVEHGLAAGNVSDPFAQRRPNAAQARQGCKKRRQRIGLHGLTVRGRLAI